jgi:hypothetical protein
MVGSTSRFSDAELVPMFAQVRPRRRQREDENQALRKQLATEGA